MSRPEGFFLLSDQWADYVEELEDRIAELEKALLEIRDSPHCHYDPVSITTYKWGVADGHRYCSQIAHGVIPKESDE